MKNLVSKRLLSRKIPDKLLFSYFINFVVFFRFAETNLLPSPAIAMIFSCDSIYVVCIQKLQIIRVTVFVHFSKMILADEKMACVLFQKVKFKII